MKVELIYGTTQDKQKVVKVLMYKSENKGVCALVDASLIKNMHNKVRDKFLYELQTSLTSCFNVLSKK